MGNEGRSALHTSRYGDESIGAGTMEERVRMLSRLPENVTLIQMKGHYRARNAKAVLQGDMSEGEAMSDFLDAFFNAGVADRQVVTFDDFVEYYMNISATFPEVSDDGAFRLFVWSCWGLDGADSVDSRSMPAGGAGGWQRNTGPGGRGGGPRNSDRSRSRMMTGAAAAAAAEAAAEAAAAAATSSVSQSSSSSWSSMDPTTMMDSIRSRLLQGPMTFDGSSIDVDGLIHFVVLLRESSLRDHGRVDRSTFHRVFLSSGNSSSGTSSSGNSSLDVRSLDVLFDAFVRSERERGQQQANGGGGTVSTSSIVDALCGKLDEERRDLVGQAYSKLDTNGDGRVHVREVAKKYLAKKHPEVVSSRRSSDEMFFNFFDNFRKLCSSQDGYITLDMFEDYYRIVSASFPDNNYFRLLMWSVWELAGNSRLTQHAQHRSVVERAPAGAGMHKPGPAHRARAFPPVERTFHQQMVVDSAATSHPDNWVNGDASDRHGQSMGIVPNAKQRRRGGDGGGGDGGASAGGGRGDWSNSPHMNHQAKRGTSDATTRTYSSTVGQIIGSGSSHSYWNRERRGSDVDGIQRNDNPTSPQELADQLKWTVRNSLIGRGVHGFVSLLRAFEEKDKGHSGRYDGNLPVSEFHAVLRASSFPVTLEQCRALFTTLGLSSGSERGDELDYGGFVEDLCGMITQTRVAMIHQAFSKFDTNKNGFVPLEHLHSGYNAAKHPDVTSGKRLASQVQREFVDNFTVADGHGKVSVEAFELYFKFVSACIMEDSNFQVRVGAHFFFFDCVVCVVFGSIFCCAQSTNLFYFYIFLFFLLISSSFPLPPSLLPPSTPLLPSS